MFRREGWNVPIEISPLGTTGYHKIDKFSYEAGADAILKSLKKGPIILGDVAREQAFTKQWYDSVTNLHKGVWVFIPDEES